MKVNRLFFLLLCLSGAARVNACDVAADFSIATNPQGTWSYGTLPALDGSFNLLTLATNNFGGVSGWNQWSTAANTTPGIYKNISSTTVTNDNAVVPPGTVVLRPGPGTAVSAVR